MDTHRTESGVAMTEDALNPYAAPSHDNLEVAATEGAWFYVVSIRKFAILYLMTVGLYGIYWDYTHWARIKRATKGSEWPVARAIFNIFFQHSLVAEIDQRLRRQSVDFQWKPNDWATPIVLVLLLSGVLNRMGARDVGGLWVDLLGFACIPVLVLLRAKVQRAANAACGDPEGRSNAGFGAANILWCVFGGLFWLLALVGTFLPEGA
jgi:hypothetical protein